jgi:hypothetical protein
VQTHQYSNPENIVFTINKSPFSISRYNVAIRNKTEQSKTDSTEIPLGIAFDMTIRKTDRPTSFVIQRCGGKGVADIRIIQRRKTEG